MATLTLPALGVAHAALATWAVTKAGRVPVLISSPGLGKSTVVGELARMLTMPLVVECLSNLDPTDLAGLPVVMEDKKSGDQHVNRVLFRGFERACNEAVVLFLDELSSVRPSVQAPAMRLLLDRVVGERTLHPGTIVVAAANPVEQASGGSEWSAAFANRTIQIMFRPAPEDTIGFFDAVSKGEEPPNLGTARSLIATAQQRDYDASLKILMADFAATLAGDPTLVREPTSEEAQAGLPFASPRAWHAGLTSYAALGRDDAEGKSDLVGFAILAGAVGSNSAAAYLGLRELRKHLPTVEEITKDPKNAKLPTERSYAVASLGRVYRVADNDPSAAVVYLARFPSDLIEVLAAAVRTVLTKCGNREKLQTGSKKGKEAVEALSKLMHRLSGVVG